MDQEEQRVQQDPKGSTGSRGATGPRGSTGAKGARGATGSVGNANAHLKFSGSKLSLQNGGQYLEKSSSGGNSWSTGYGYSSLMYTGGCSVSFRPAYNTKSFMVGLSDFSTNHSSKYVNIDYAFYPHSGKAYQIYESGSIRRKTSSVANWGGYSNTTIFTITYDNHSVRYFVNGSLIRTVSAGANRKFAVYASGHNTGTLTTMLSFMPMAQRGSTGA